MEKMKRDGRGGARPGAGRKGEGRVTVSFRLASETVAKIRNEAERRGLPASRVLDEIVAKCL